MKLPDAFCARLWDIGVDYDYPADKIKLRVQALTGTRFNTETLEVEVMEPEDWVKVKAQYMEFSRKHYRECRYPEANVFRKLFPKESEKIK